MVRSFYSILFCLLAPISAIRSCLTRLLLSVTTLALPPLLPRTPAPDRGSLTMFATLLSSLPAPTKARTKTRLASIVVAFDQCMDLLVQKLRISFLDDNLCSQLIRHFVKQHPRIRRRSHFDEFFASSTTKTCSSIRFDRKDRNKT